MDLYGRCIYTYYGYKPTNITGGTGKAPTWRVDIYIYIYNIYIYYIIYIIYIIYYIYYIYYILYIYYIYIIYIIYIYIYYIILSAYAYVVVWVGGLEVWEITVYNIFYLNSKYVHNQ